MVDHVEKLLKIEHPCNVKHPGGSTQHQLKIIFLPNLILRKDLKQSMNFSNCIHIFDEELLLPRNVIEKRQKVYKALGTSISFDYFGNQVWEQTQEDAWLIASIRERVGD